MANNIASNPLIAYIHCHSCGEKVSIHEGWLTKATQPQIEAAAYLIATDCQYAEKMSHWGDRQTSFPGSAGRHPWNPDICFFIGGPLDGSNEIWNFTGQPIRFAVPPKFVSYHLGFDLSKPYFLDIKEVEYVPTRYIVEGVRIWVVKDS